MNRAACRNALKAGSMRTQALSGAGCGSVCHAHVRLSRLRPVACPAKGFSFGGFEAGSSRAVSSHRQGRSPLHAAHCQSGDDGAASRLPRNVSFGSHSRRYQGPAWAAWKETPSYRTTPVCLTERRDSDLVEPHDPWQVGSMRGKGMSPLGHLGILKDTEPRSRAG